MLSHLHPLLVHFPIVLWILTSAALLHPRWRREEPLLKTLLWLSLGSTVLAIATGLLFASEQSFNGRAGEIILLHRNLAIGAGGLALLGGALRLRGPSRVATALILAATLLVAGSAHFGGMSVFGEDFFSFASKKPAPPPAPAPAPGTEAEASAPLDYATQVRPVLKACFRCHGRKKQKGELRLDRRAAALKGGEDGPAIVPGDLEKSLLYERISLPTDHDDYMPNKGDPLTPGQVELLKRWIVEGAAYD